MDPDDSALPDSPAVPMGQAMPETRQLPTLLPSQQAVAAAPARMRGLSTLGEGLRFVGDALIDGSLSVAGEVRGNLHVQAGPGGDGGHVTVAATGSVTGDVTARHISVLGRADGLLDAAGGRVSLHDTACVSGRIRYTHLQVNGADLNAQLERVRPEGDVGRT
ncbi:polymer-forming cytoskeletal protein [Ideonella sp.]|uniref:bactofilin family protein n=1 Tax=Ideonella sp. TaxID=1929293 RepID=UPI0035B3C9B4